MYWPLVQKGEAVEFTVVRKVQLQEQERAGHIASEERKQSADQKYSQATAPRGLPPVSYFFCRAPLSQFSKVPVTGPPAEE